MGRYHLSAKAKILWFSSIVSEFLNTADNGGKYCSDEDTCLFIACMPDAYGKFYEALLWAVSDVDLLGPSWFETEESVDALDKVLCDILLFRNASADNNQLAISCHHRFFKEGRALSPRAVDAFKDFRSRPKKKLSEKSKGQLAEMEKGGYLS